ncbi:MAG: serine/threonine protein kinase, partial [Pirellulales bacterium]|nr:serine/threonine protein kinase [Pirellulales bacterium]
GGVVTCLDAATGKRMYEKRLEAPPAAPAKAAADSPSERPEQPPGFGRPGEFAEARSFGGGMRRQDYSSPDIGDGKRYFVRRGGEAYVLALGPQFKQLAVNRLASDDDFNATPAIADGAIFIRSSHKLYCVANE